MRPIDADALIEEVNKKQVVGRFNTIMLINDAPTVEQKDWKFYYDHGYAQAKRKYEKPQGEWKIVKQDNEGIHEIECPFCKYSRGSDFSSILTVTFERFPPFCENCGADLRGG